MNTNTSTYPALLTPPWPIPLYPALHYRTLPDPILSCPTLPDPIVPYPTLLNPTALNVTRDEGGSAGQVPPPSLHS